MCALLRYREASRHAQKSFLPTWQKNAATAESFTIGGAPCIAIHPELAAQRQTFLLCALSQVCLLAQLDELSGARALSDAIG